MLLVFGPASPTVARCNNRGEQSESVIPVPHRYATTRLTLIRFESFRKVSRWTAPPASPSSASTSEKRSKTRKTFHLGRYYVTFGRHSINKPTPSQCYAELSGYTCASNLESGYCPSELPDYESLFAVLPIISCDKSTPELSADCSGSLQELPDPASMETATLERNAVYELDSDRPIIDGFQHPPMDSVGYYHFDKQQGYAPHGLKRQAFAPVPAPAPLPRLRTDESLNLVPSLARANNSHTPSPVSPVTPSLQTTDCAEVEQQADVSPISVSALQYQPAQLLLQQYGANEFAPQYASNGLSYSGTESAFPFTQAENFLCSKPLLRYCKHDIHHNTHFTSSLAIPAHVVGSNRHFDRGSAVPGNLGWSSGVSWNDTESHFTMNSINITAQTNDVICSDTCFNAHTTAGQSNKDAYVPKPETGDDRHAFRHPRERCNICGGEFTGK
jgi:hypothetical protein